MRFGVCHFSLVLSGQDRQFRMKIKNLSSLCPMDPHFVQSLYNSCVMVVYVQSLSKKVPNLSNVCQTSVCHQKQVLYIPKQLRSPEIFKIDQNIELSISL